MRKLAVCVPAVAVVVVSVLVALNGAAAYDVDSTGPFNIASQDGTSTVYSGLSKTLGIRVTVDTGTVDVEDLSGGSTVTLGTIDAGEFCIFEGSYTSVRVKATSVGGATGSYENREITGGGDDADGIIGAGSITLSGSAVRVYKTSNAVHRAIFVTVTDGTVGIRTSSGGPDIITIENGDSATIAGDSMTEFWLSGTGAADAKTQKPDGTESWSGWVDNSAHGDNDTDDLDKPGSTTCYEYQVKNTSEGIQGGQPGKITVLCKKEGEGQQEQTTEVDPGDTTTFSCNMEYVKVTYENTGGKCQWRKRKES